MMGNAVPGRWRIRPLPEQRGSIPYRREFEEEETSRLLRGEDELVNL